MRKSLVCLFAFLLPFSNVALAAGKFIKPTVGVPHSSTQPQFVEVYGHRGARSYSPENTIPAYATALKVGVNWVDMDIAMTKDGKIIVTHDLQTSPNILRDKTGKFVQPKLVYDMTLPEIKELDAGRINPTTPYAKMFPDQVAADGTKIPTLQEVFDYVKKNTDGKVNFQIEMKNDPEHPDWSPTPQKFAKALYLLLKKNNLLRRVEVQSFDWRNLYELQNLDSDIKTVYLVGSVDDIALMKSPDPKVAGLWTGGKLLKDYDNSLPKMIKALGGACYEPEDLALTKKDLDEAHALGLKVVVWTWPEHAGTTFDPVVIERLIKWGIDGIIADDPARLDAMLAARGYPVPRNYPAN